MTLAICSALPGCEAFSRKDPFPPLGPLAPEEQVALVQSRARAARTLSAVVQAAIESRELSGSFDVICLYREPGHLLMSASKGLLFSSRPLFEIAFTPTRYRLSFYKENGEVEKASGNLADFPRDQPRLAELFWIRDALFRAGELDETKAPIRLADHRLTGKTSIGASVEYTLAASTLAVERASLLPPDRSDPLHIRYLEYRAAGNAIVPVRVEVDGKNFHMQAVAGDLEVNQPLPDGVFETAVP